MNNSHTHLIRKTSQKSSTLKIVNLFYGNSSTEPIVSAWLSYLDECPYDLTVLDFPNVNNGIKVRGVLWVFRSLLHVIKPDVKIVIANDIKTAFICLIT